MIKAIFVDLDATLLSDDKTICKRNLEIIKEVEDNGIKFLYCTGRLPFCFEEYKVLNLSDFISANGSVVIKDNKVIQANYLTYETKKKVLEYAINHGDFARMFALDYLYLINTYNQNIDSNEYEKSSSIDNVKAKELIKDVDVVKFGFINKDSERLEEIRRDLEKMDLDVEMFYSGSHYLEVCKKGINKGTGIKEYCRLNNIDIKNIIGIGDNDNDKTMLEITGISACPSNAIDSIKDIVDYVSPLDNNQGAVAEIIDKYVFDRK